MVAERILIVAGKEFSDHLTSRKFLVILALLLMLTLLGMHQGIDQYNQNLEVYNQQLQAAGDATGSAGMMPERPSILSIFQHLESSLIVFGGVLAIATGADLVSKEKESRSLKSLLSHPVYRDEVINGKALGGMAALGVALAVAFTLTSAVLLVFSIVPTAGEVVAILIFGFASFLFLLAFFALALALSVVVKESGHAVVYGLTLFFAFTYLLQMFGMVLGGVVAGDIPQGPERPVTVDGRPVDEAVWKAYEEESRQYIEEMEIYRSKQQFVTDTVNIFSPMMAYNTVASTVAYPSELPPEDAASRIWRNFAALLVFPSVFFAAAYVKFMRMDIR
ncbi:MAG: ABC transporter permease subunit [Candidatus Methanoculleus thermohydrogenotrophicum]|jgi:ABC-2 type transport system permease protein|nr:ABC transporter permease subunit [Candidatus Methanoculleus thermohydrogenotrophicum]NLM82199.1 ABC transporter permease [Candidatus Methanoculleus thermohydrogenotrophicum]